MKTRKFLFSITVLLYFAGSTVAGGAEKLVLWYDRPADRWTEALPVGNGRLGAMIFGGAREERLQMNEDTLWSGGPREWNNPGALEALPEVRKMVFEGRYHDADNRLEIINAELLSGTFASGDPALAGGTRLSVEV